MTEQEWLQATDPEPMLEYLRGKASDRKLRLFVVSCCYQEYWRSTIVPMLEVAEKFADEPTVVRSTRLKMVRRGPCQSSSEAERHSSAAGSCGEGR
jgi:hypothetical protein